jgi:hypothetical protein
MKKILLTSFLLAAFSIFMQADPSTAMTVSDYPTGSMANGIVSSRHNMGAFGRVITTAATTEICIFCHTPHHSNRTGGVVPLWNRGVGSGYVAYGTTIAGTEISDGDIGGATLACLSCHDGVTTFDNIVNAPGKGGVVPGGLDRVWKFRMPSEYVASHKDFDRFGSDSCKVCHGLPGTTDYQSNVARLNIGTDLSNDHPVSVPYLAGEVASLRPVGTVINSIVMTDGMEYETGVGGDFDDLWNNNLSQNRWAVNGFISDTATIGSLLRNGMVECSSCHDPHFRNLSWDEVEDTWADGLKTIWCGNDGENCSDGLFLRRVGGNSGSAICRTCHAK